jgi:hypothetical protein
MVPASDNALAVDLRATFGYLPPISRKPVIQMSGSRRALGLVLVAFGFGTALAGCCGSGSSHKCDFTPPSAPQNDAASDAPLPCGTEVCALPQVCCLKKVPPSAMCVDQVDFVADGCETADLPCAVPADCPTGLVCCVPLSATAVSCRPREVCPGDGRDTLLACATVADCPGTNPSCQPLGTEADGSVILSVCVP